MNRVRTLTGKEIELDIEPDYKVSKIKERVEEKEGIPPVQQRLIYGGKQMYVAHARAFLRSHMNEVKRTRKLTVALRIQGRRQDGRRVQPRGWSDVTFGSCTKRRTLASSLALNQWIFFQRIHLGRDASEGGGAAEVAEATAIHFFGKMPLSAYDRLCILQCTQQFTAMKCDVS